MEVMTEPSYLGSGTGVCFEDGGKMPPGPRAALMTGHLTPFERLKCQVQLLPIKEETCLVAFEFGSIHGAYDNAVGALVFQLRHSRGACPLTAHEVACFIYLHRLERQLDHLFTGIVRN